MRTKMARTGVLMTKTERRRITGEENVEDRKRYQAILKFETESTMNW